MDRTPEHLNISPYSPEFFFFFHDRVICFFLPLITAWKTAELETCIWAMDIGTVSGITSMIACQAECESTNLECLSVDWKSDQNICYFNGADSSTELLRYCGSFQYSEPTGW